MKTSNFFSVFVCLISVFLLLSACSKSEGDMDGLNSLESEFKLNGSKKVDVCHNGQLINISINAIPAHQKHGDAFDMDGDGYFDIENSCGPTDCHDTDPEVTAGTDGDCDPGSVAELLLGTWTTSDLEFLITVGELSALEYLTDVVGLTPEEAADRIAALEAELIFELDVVLTFNADGTYASSFGGGTDSGTWELSPDETTLTLFEGPETIVATIVSISETTLVAILADVFPFDLDGDPGTSEEVYVEATMTLSR